MTPKEKAIELVRQFSFIEYDQVKGVKIHNPTLELKFASQQCAIISVDEILSNDFGDKQWWKQVKIEIDNLP